MIDQFEAKRCLHLASTDNLVLTIIDNRPDLGYPGTRVGGRCKTLAVAWGGGIVALGID